jgi:hypothetical protein
MEGKAMCYGIKELVSKRSRKENVVRIPRTPPERAWYSKMETMVRTWLNKKLGLRTREKEKQPEWV